MKSVIVTAVLLNFVPLVFGQWQQQAIPSEADFRGLSAVNVNVAWVSGTKGTVGRTIDGGKTWQVLTVPGAEKLDFRDIEAFSDTTATILSIGPGEDSRIYKTTDGGTSWTLQFRNPDKEAFFDALAFWDETHGLALSDPVNGKYRLVATDNAGKTWTPLPSDKMPAALAKEGAFAASGTCLIARGKSDAWFVTGGGPHARVFHTTNRGQSWTLTETPIAGGIDSAGAFSIAFRDDTHGIIVGGDYKKVNETGATAAVTSDGGKTWTVLEQKLPFRSGIVWAKDRWIAVGPSGSEVSTDDGVTWKSLDIENYNTLSFTKVGDGWAAGPKARIAKFVIER
ncbi:oxidoreductase [soil metagenome]